MAKKLELPDPLSKRDIIFGEDTPREDLIAYGKAFLEQEQIYDALSCFAQAKAHDEIEKIAEIAMEEGDAALWQETLIVRGKKADPEEWRQLAKRAEALGKEYFAEFAYEQAGDEAKALQYRQKREQEKFRAARANEDASTQPQE